MNPFDEGTQEHAEWERQSASEGAAILDDVAEWIGGYLSVPSEHYITVAALWAAHTHVIEAFYVTPRLVIDSAEPESGKTRVLELLNLLVHTPIFTMNTTIAALYRRLNSGPRTILLDETDAVFAKGAAQNHEDLRAILNAGYKRGATVDRCVTKANELEVVEFPVFAPVALAGIAGNMPDTITTRAITLHMRRRAPGEHVREFIEEDAVDEAEPLRKALAEWARSVSGQVKGHRPSMPAGVRDRKAEIWRAILALADAAGAAWSERARDACKYFVLGTSNTEIPLSIRLLSDLRDTFAGADRMFTADILTRLAAIDEAPWGDMYGKPIDARRLSKMLGKYGVSPKLVKIAGVAGRGYTLEDLYDVWLRYLPTKSVTGVTDVTSQVNPVTDTERVTDTSVTGAVSVTGLSSQVTEVAPVTDIPELPLRTPEPCPCGRPKHSPGDWSACGECGHTYHRYGPKRLAACPHCAERLMNTP